MKRVKFVPAMLIGFAFFFCSHCTVGLQDPATAPMAMPTLPTPSYLPNITGLSPYVPPPASSNNVAGDISNALGTKDCGGSVPARIRALAFFHFTDLQTMENAQGLSINSADIAIWAHRLGMLLKESSGDPDAVTNISGVSSSSEEPVSNIGDWNGLFSHIPVASETNYGLLQMSPDRLTVGLSIPSSITTLLHPLGIGGDPNTSTAIVSVLKVYQQMAQGRVVNSDLPIPQNFLTASNANPNLVARAEQGIQSALWHCGTRYVFSEGEQGTTGQAAMETAMRSIAYCSFNDPTGTNAEECFARWVTLCPAANFDVALITPDSYFATAGAANQCLATFQSLMKSK